MTRKSFKYRLYPNANQWRELERTLETHRRLYNQALDERMLCWDTAGVSLNFPFQSRRFTVLRKSNSHYSQLNVTSAQLTLKRLDLSYRRFFKTGGFPRFKGKDQFSSFSYNYVGNGTQGCKIKGGKLRLQHIGDVRVKWHRDIPPEAKIKQATIIHSNGKWYVAFAVELPDEHLEPLSAVVGVDVGLTSFVTTSDGEEMGDSKILDRNLKQLRRRNRALARCKRGSNRRKKVKHRLAALHEKVRNTRRDMQHKVSRSLVDRYGVIAAESLNIKGMIKNRRLARRIADAGWYSFIQILTYKAESAGGRVILVNPRNTSQECSSCGATVKKDLSVRIHKCDCGCVLDRDHNAALNILKRAREEPGYAKPEVTLVCAESAA